MEKQTYEAIIELYVDDKLYKAVSEDEWDDTLEELNDILRSKGYHKQYDGLPGFEHPSSYVHVWINWDKKKIVTVCHKARTKLKDSKGNVLYEDDIVYYDGFHKLTVPLCAKPWNEGYYVREYLTHEGMCSRVSDTNIDEHNVHMLTKVKDVINFPEKYWNKVKKLDIGKL
jgi:hypothetical protein